MGLSVSKGAALSPMQMRILLAMLVLPATLACKTGAYTGCYGDCPGGAICGSTPEGECGCPGPANPCPGGSLKACVQACSVDIAVKRIYDICVQGCNEKCPHTSL